MRGLIAGLAIVSIAGFSFSTWLAARPDHMEGISFLAASLVEVLGAPTSIAILFFLDHFADPLPGGLGFLVYLPIPLNWFLIGAVVDWRKGKKEKKESSVD